MKRLRGPHAARGPQIADSWPRGEVQCTAVNPDFGQKSSGATFHSALAMLHSLNCSILLNRIKWDSPQTFLRPAAMLVLLIVTSSEHRAHFPITQTSSRTKLVTVKVKFSLPGNQLSTAPQWNWRTCSSTRRSQWPCGLRRGSWLVDCWDRGFESRSRHGYLSASFCVVLSCVGRGLAMGWSLVQGVLQYVGFEVLTAVGTKMAVFWVVAPCSLVEIYKRFRGPCCLHH
jgi:hypothetical protein